MPPQALMQQQLAAQRSAQQQTYAAQQADAGSQRARTSGSRPAGNGWKPIKVSPTCIADALLQWPRSRPHVRDAQMLSRVSALWWQADVGSEAHKWGCVDTLLPSHRVRMTKTRPMRRSRRGCKASTTLPPPIGRGVVLHRLPKPSSRCYSPSA